ncbi:MAG: DUF1674 domain-containing protein [Gammaproteobacteria bacterium]|nr:DUF1674 domain-containing protein [Gammaproteobacteria bacterium]MDH4313539.1 DUF1674 domain-containing protein [Gammaproteobacteria bacterium]MDH5212608.1 DUF1674 domain-containing protein [Gammaproteobacteria bacterium]MDH5499906.1 DUF1674 domain-containing protein [Gammaproteobacteria bacterium]
MRGQDNEPAAPRVKNGLSEPEHKVRSPQKEIGGREGPDPTRFGDWEKAGRCIDF